MSALAAPARAALDRLASDPGQLLDALPDDPVRALRDALPDDPVRALRDALPDDPARAILDALPGDPARVLLDALGGEPPRGLRARLGLRRRRPASPRLMASRGVLGTAFVGAGINHFVRPRVYEKIMPPYLPWHRALVLVSGAAEVAGGVGVLVPRTRRLAGWWLVALLVAVFPANVHMALEPDDPAWEKIPTSLLWLRLPLQGLAAWWALDATRDRR